MNAVVVFLDVGQGDSTTLIDVDAKEAVVIDCPDGHNHTLLRILRQFGINRINMAVASHTHWDHIGGMYALLSDCLARELRLNWDALPNRESYERMRLKTTIRGFRSLEDKVGLRLHSLLAGETGNIGGITWRCIAPTYGQVLAALDEGDRNHAAAILKFQLGPLSVLVGSDADGKSWRQAMDREEDLHADVFRLPHHGGEFRPGGERASIDEILDRVGAAHHVVSVGTRNNYGHPAHTTLEALGVRGARARVLCTQVNSVCLGAVPPPRTLSTTAPSTVFEVPSRGGGIACAGTVMVRLEGDHWRVEPSVADHDQIIDRLGRPMCREYLRPDA